MTDQPERDERLITFRGREIAVRFPTSGQLMVYQRSLKEIQSQTTGDWDGEKALSAMVRLGRILDSVMLDRTDREWLDDITLDEGLELIDRVEILRLTVEAYADKTEETEPTKKAAPAKRARRKAS
jgi:hypothetical protein